MLGLRFDLIVPLFCGVLLVGCSQPAQKLSATRPPSPETVTVELGTDLGVLGAHTTGLARPSSPNPPKELLEALRPLLSDAIPTLVTLGDTVKFDGRFPGEKKNWSKWDQGVEKVVRKQMGAKTPTLYEMWNEPDRPASFKGNQSEFFAVWVHTTKLIRSIDPKAQLIGPTISKYDYGWTQEFLKISKEYGEMPNIVCWHENTSLPDLKGHVNSLGEAFWQDGTDRFHMLILPSAAIDRHYSPAEPILFLAALQEAYRQSKFRGIDERFGIKLHHLTTKEHAPRSLYHAYAAYADLLEAGGHAVKLLSSKSVDGMATWANSGRNGQVLLGRKLPRQATTKPTTQGTKPVVSEAPPQLPGPLTVVLQNVSGSAATVKMTFIADSGAEAQSTKPSPGAEVTLPVEHGEVKIGMPELKDGEACLVEFKVTGPATTQASTRGSSEVAR